MKKTILKLCFMPLTLLNRFIKKDKKLVFFYSNLGFRDNVRAVYDYMVEHGYNKEYRLVCAINEWREFERKKAAEPEQYQNIEYVSLKKGIFTFLKAGYAFYSFGKYPIKPSAGQTVVNVWHGMPLKRIGNMESGKERIKYNYFTYVIATSDFWADIMAKSFSCDRKQVLINGQPRNDILFKENKALDEKICKGIKKLILWLPTYRDNATLQNTSYESPISILEDESAKKLDEWLGRNDMKLVVKHHPLQQEKVNKRFKNIEIYTHQEFQNTEGELYDYLRNADALITDFSSVYFDYMLLDRPIAFVTGDMEQYGDDRGFVFDNPTEMMPGRVIKTPEELFEFAADVAAGVDEYADKRREVNCLVNDCRDGNSTKLLLNRILK